MNSTVVNKRSIWLIAVYAIGSVMIIPYAATNATITLILSDIPLLLILYHTLVCDGENKTNDIKHKLKDVSIGLMLGICFIFFWIKEITVKPLPLILEDTLMLFLIKYILLFITVVITRKFITKEK